MDIWDSIKNLDYFSVISGIIIGAYVCYFYLTRNSVKENARFGKILKNLWEIGHKVGVKDGDEKYDIRYDTTNQIDQIELWVELIKSKLNSNKKTDL